MRTNRATTAGARGRRRATGLQRVSWKLDAMEGESLPPRLVGPDAYDTLLVCWGSTLHTIREALQELPLKGVAALHFSQVYPLHESSAGLLSRAKKRIIVEQNATSQFGTLVKMVTGLGFDQKVLKYDGMPFTKEEIIEVLKGLS